MVVLRDFLFDVVEIFDCRQCFLYRLQQEGIILGICRSAPSKDTAGEDDKKVCNYFKCLKFHQYYSPVLRHISSEVVEHVG